MNAWQQQLQEMERRWSARPATVPYDWAREGEAVAVRYPGRGPAHATAKRLWAEGRVVWGSVLAAASTAFEPGVLHEWADLIWSDDPFVQADPRLLLELGDLFWVQRETDISTPHLGGATRFARDSTTMRAQIRRYPGLLSAGRVVWHCGCIVYRSHLPGGFIREKVVPMLREPDHRVDGVMLLPSAFWADALLGEWERG